MDFSKLASPKTLLSNPVFLWLVIFLVALGPRLANLDVFSAPDEFYWVTGSSNFARGLADGNLGQTYHAGQPGVTLMWVETLGFWGRQLLGQADWQSITSAEKTMTVLSNQRQAAAIAGALLAAAIALLVRRLFGNQAAWLAGFLLAFDPFLLTESRVVRTEGLLAYFNTLALLSLLLFYWHRSRLLTAGVAGVLTGMSILSKISALPLLPVGALVIAGAHLLPPTKKEWSNTIRAITVWGGGVLLTIILLWPALAVTPGEVLQKMYEFTFIRAVEGEGGAKTFFMGRPYFEEDPGWFFYPVVLLYRTTPLMWTGLLLLVLAIWPGRIITRQQKSMLGLMLLYLLLYLALISQSFLKFDRYTVPMIPTLNIMAAVGITSGWRWLTTRHQRLVRWGWLVAAGVLVGQVITAWPHHPYYYTYWNPLLGGMKQAVNVLPVATGGEGIDQVATFVNTLPNADSLTLATANSQKIRPLLRSNTLPMTNVDGDWYLADYTFLYISQTQRGKHDQNIVEYLQRRPPLYVLTIAGVEYAWVYPGPGAQYWGGDTTLEGRGTLHAYDLSETTLTAGQILTGTVYFRNEGQQPDDRFYVRLVDSDSYLWAADRVKPRPGFETAFITREAITEGEFSLQLPISIPPGRYVLKMGFDDVKTGQPIGRFVLPEETDTITVNLPDNFEGKTVQPPQALQLPLEDDLQITGYDLSPKQAAAEQSIWLTLYWQALTDVNRDYVVAVQLLDSAGNEATYWLGRPVRSGYPTNQWRRGQLVQDPWRLPLPAELAAGQYTLAITIYNAETETMVTTATLDTIQVTTNAN